MFEGAMSETKRTAFAMQALGLAELFNFKVGDQKVGQYRVELSAPDGPSTGGGKQSVQHVKLVPDDGGAVLVAGSADQVGKTAELRTYEYLADLHAQRFKGAKLPLEKTAYLELVGRMRAFFADQGLHVVMLEVPRPPAVARASAGPGLSTGSMIGVFLGVAAVIAAAVFLFLRTK